MRVTDQLGFMVEVPDLPRRIVSLVPSITELLAHLALDKEVLGITKFCEFPEEWRKTKVRVGGTKNPDVKAIELLNPDLIIGNKEENTQEMLLKLKTRFPVWISDIENLEQAVQMIEALGALTRRSMMATELNQQIGAAFRQIEPVRPAKRCLYLIWRNPYMVAGSHTFIDDMLKRCGFENAAANLEGRYPELDEDGIRSLAPDLVLLSSEPYPFKDSHANELRALLPNTSRCMLVDGTYFSWYGSRLVESPTYFKKVLNVWKS
jgi:ABC-type Fe3+-hydroxamate transport system substrate-binding protein